MPLKKGLTAAAVLLAASGGAWAEDSYPKFSGEIGIEVQNDFTFDSDDPAAEQNELGPRPARTSFCISRTASTSMQGCCWKLSGTRGRRKTASSRITACSSRC